MDAASFVPNSLRTLYDKFYKDPADKEKAALDTAQQQSFAEAERNRQFQLGGLDRALSFYGPARNVLSEMMGGAPQGGYGQLATPPPPKTDWAGTKDAFDFTHKHSGKTAPVGQGSWQNDAVGPSQGTTTRDTVLDALGPVGTANRIQQFGEDPSLSTGARAAASFVPGANLAYDAGKAAYNKVKFW